MAMLAPVHVENFGQLFGSNQPISADFTAFNSSDQLQRKRSSILQEALLKPVFSRKRRGPICRKQPLARSHGKRH
jgi:hypothetical protein